MFFLPSAQVIFSVLFTLQVKKLPLIVPHTSEKAWWANVPVGHGSKSAAHESTGHNGGPPCLKVLASPLSSSFQIPLETPSLFPIYLSSS